MKILSDMVKEMGIRGMYTGTVATGMRDVPFSIVYFSLYGMSTYLLMRACMRASMHACMHRCVRTGTQPCISACPHTQLHPSVSMSMLLDP